MSKFYLKNIKRTMFVIIGEKIFLSLPNLLISHGDWFKSKGWMDDDNKTFVEENPRGYIDEEGIYIYQGYNARIPEISKCVLNKVIKNLCTTLNIDKNLHVFLGTIMPKNKEGREGKLTPKKDLGSILNIINKK